MVRSVTLQENSSHYIKPYTVFCSNVSTIVVMDRETLYTIGHSNHSVERFIELLQLNKIEAVVDVRTTPYSQWATQHNQKPLAKQLASSSIHYLFFGDFMGGRPERTEFYTPEGYVKYSCVASTKQYEQYVQRIEHGLKSMKIAIMCGEENPLHCHRRLLITRTFIDNGFPVNHIRGTGDQETEESIRQTEMDQMGFFGDTFPTKDSLWLSSKPVKIT